MEKFDVEIFLDKSKIKKVYIVGLILFLVSVGCIIWATLNWEEYTELRQKLNGRVVETGLASILYGWGWGFAVAIPVIYGIMWFTLDFKNPTLAVNKEGLFKNGEFFKKTFLPWSEFSSVQKQENGDLWMQLKDPQKIVDQQSGMGKAFLKQTYVKDNSPITISNDGSDANYAKMIAFIEENYIA